MDIKNIAISTKIVIESLVCLLENENVDLSSIKFKVGSASEGYESPDMEFGKLIDIALDGLEELKENPTKAPEGFVLVPVKEIKTWYLDDSENIYREDPDWLCDIAIGEVVEVEHRVSYELDQDPVFATIQWDEKNGDVGYYKTFKSKDEAEKVAAHCKAMIEAQEQNHD
ncbi:hypothetical protein ACK2M2_02580 [Acinetobacter sp. TY1]|uniref:hypothetical protein n=1 Tax=Acinetobacter sp. TY1 TaxID=3387626 RepID=UPI003AF58A25